MGNQLSINAGSYLNPGIVNTNQGANGKGIFAAGSQPGVKNNPLIERKKQLAGKQAMKLITDAYARDNAVSDSKKELSARKAEAVREINENKKGINEIDKQTDDLKKQYGVAPDSQEQKDLELLMRYQDARNGVKYSHFTDEEKDRLKELEGTARTEYQSRVLELNEEKGALVKKNNNLDSEIKAITASEWDLEQSQLKSQDMLNANKAADEIMDAASKEAIGQLVSDAKDAIEERAEEAKENGEKFEEAREKLEERIEESKERRKEEQEIIENSGKMDTIKADVDIKTSNNSAVSKAQESIKRILADNNLLDEDIKGLNIDFGF